jgi:hypothetical protein
MLTLQELASLSRTLEHERVLTVYLDGSISDPAARRAWRVELDHALDDLRRWLEGSTHEERERFRRDIATLERELAPMNGAVGAPGWVAFIVNGEVRAAERLAAPTPTIAVWSTGPCIAPYMRVLKETRPAVVIVADARRADLYRYHLGALERLEALRAQVTVEPPSHMGAAPAAGFHTGTRGETGREAAQRSQLEGTRDLLSRAATLAIAAAGPEGWILLGGIPEVTTRLLHLIEPLRPTRASLLPKLDVHAPESEIARAARECAAQLREAADLRQIDEMLDSGQAAGLATLGPAETRAALADGRVRELFFSERYVLEHAADAELAVRSALAQHAVVEQVSREAAQRLDEHGGMAARLRYRVASTEIEREPAALAGVPSSSEPEVLCER